MLGTGRSLRSGLGKRQPSWWPTGKSFTLLDLRQGSCTCSVFEPDRPVTRVIEPAFVRLGLGGLKDVVSWGESAKAWLGRGPRGQVVKLFEEGFIKDYELAREYWLSYSRQHLSKFGARRVWVVNDDQRSWAAPSWPKVLKGSGWAWAGELRGWQHDLFMMSEGRLERALFDVLHIELGAHSTSWCFLRAGEIVLEGQSWALSRLRLVGWVKDYVRRHLDLEMGHMKVEDLLEASCPEKVERGWDGSVLVVGRQIHSGLPSRIQFCWPTFLRESRLLGVAWREIKAQILSQVQDVTGSPLSLGLGLDLPGWRVLSHGQSASLFVEGPVISWLERAW